MKYTTVIFDLDGTLLDTIADIGDACNSVLRRQGLPEHTVDNYRRYLGDGLHQLMNRATPTTSTECEVEHCCELFLTEYGKCWDSKSRPYRGITEMLAALDRSGVKMAVLSNKPQQFTEKCVARFFSDGIFSLVFGQRAGVPTKPDPAGALEIASTLNVAPGKCLYIGDTDVDMQTGKRAGMVTAGVLWGYRDRSELIRNNADLLVQIPQEIVEHVVSSH